MTWTEAGIILSVFSAAVLIMKELYTTFWVNRRKDKQVMSVAKAQQPEIMRQLELGNFKAAAEGISIAQTFVADQLRFAQAEIEKLRQREIALEAEVAGWEKRDKERELHSDEVERRMARIEGRNDVLQSQLTECKKHIFGSQS
jgi:hypothetical protein